MQMARVARTARIEFILRVDELQGRRRKRKRGAEERYSAVQREYAMSRSYRAASDGQEDL